MVVMQGQHEELLKLETRSLTAASIKFVICFSPLLHSVSCIRVLR